MGRDREQGQWGGTGEGGGMEVGGVEKARKVNSQNFMLLKHPFEALLPKVQGLRLRLLPSKEESIEHKIIPQFEV